MASLLPCSAPGAGLTFSGNNISVLEVTPDPATGLEKIYVAYTANGLVLHYESTQPVKWYKYSNLGGGFAEEITGGITFNGYQSSLTSPEADMGYIVEEADGRQHCFWLTGYAPYRLDLKSASAAPIQDCDASLIDIEGTGIPIHYYTVLGQQRVLDRMITANYNTLVWNESKNQFDLQPVSVSFESLPSQMRIVPPALCQTDFNISGDRFLKQWNWEESVSTGAVAPTAVEVHTRATQHVSSSTGDKSNIVKTGDETGLGDSAPVAISFEAWTSDGVVHNEWQLSRDASFASVDYRFNEQDMEYNFTEQGTFFARFIGSNSDGSCRAVGPVYTVSIGTSELRIPNVFSPNGDGINDEWKVAYRSLLSFECWIYDRYGNQIKHFSNPDEGWDGKRGGKSVAPGVYYYVITAQGADGKKYKKSGDINIIRSENLSDGNTTNQR